MHLGLIIDGNRRWAKERFLPKSLGHKKGVDNLKKILKICAKRKDINIVSVFTLSTENMKREKKELENLFSLIESFAKSWQDFCDDGISVRVLGDISVLPDSCQKALKNLEKKTKTGKNLLFCPAINYGGQAEILSAVNQAIQNGEQLLGGEFEDFLQSSFLPPINLMIRSGGKKRISNFMIWHLAYAELFFTSKMWPAFSEEDLEEAINFYKSTQRNFGE